MDVSRTLRPDRRLPDPSSSFLTEQDQARVRPLAAELERMARNGEKPTQRLRGKHLVVLCEPPNCTDLAVVREAAAALGVRVTHIRPSEMFNGLSGSLNEVGALLGKLYDGIDCHDLAPEVFAQLARAAGKPVFQSCGCSDPRSPMNPFTLQAWLLTAMA